VLRWRIGFDRRTLVFDETQLAGASDQSRLPLPWGRL